MEILVSGASGFLGTHLIEKLLQNGHKVLALTHKNIPLNISNSQWIQEGLLQWRPIDITNPTNYFEEDFKGVDAVFHLAGSVDLKDANDPLKVINSNVMGTGYMLAVCSKYGVKRFILASSIYVSEQKRYLHAATKKCAEELCRSFQITYDLSYTLLRYGPIYGEGGNRGIVSLLIKKALEGKPLVIHGDGSQSRHFIYVDDAIEASLLILDKDISLCTIMGDRGISLKTLAETIIREVGGDCTIIYDKTNMDTYYGGSDIANRTQELLNWKPKVGLEEGIKRTVKWHREQIERKETQCQ